MSTIRSVIQFSFSLLQKQATVRIDSWIVDSSNIFHRHDAYPNTEATVLGTASKRLTTSRSAVAKRPHDASCLSVVNFDSTKRRTESFIVSYICRRFITACN